jgi:hypothetical protein
MLDVRLGATRMDPVRTSAGGDKSVYPDATLRYTQPSFVHRGKPHTVRR